MRETRESERKGQRGKERERERKRDLLVVRNFNVLTYVCKCV